MSDSKDDLKRLYKFLGEIFILANDIEDFAISRKVGPIVAAHALRLTLLNCLSHLPDDFLDKSEKTNADLMTKAVYKMVGGKLNLAAAFCKRLERMSDDDENMHRLMEAIMSKEAHIMCVEIPEMDETPLKTDHEKSEHTSVNDLLNKIKA